jgi:two-component sensor histidine kinase
MDALAAAGAGYVGIALMGAMPPFAALDLTARLLAGTMVYLVIDRDPSGIAAVSRTLPYLLSKGLKVKVVDPYPSKDLAEVDSSENNWLNAYNNYRIFTIYNDSINNKDNTEKIKQSQIQYELEKKDLEYQKLMALKAIQFEYQQKQAAVKTEKEKQKLSFEQQIKEQKLSFDYSQKVAKVQNEQKQQLALNAILAKENNLMIKNSKNESIIRWFMILALFALIAFGFYYYKNFKTQKVSNVIIAKQREDLKALIHELNHRVKNNFQTVASMLSMQTRLLEDTILADVLMQTSNRFLAIASVHEKLYQLESFSDIPIKDYLNDIVTNISTQFGVNKNSFEYEIVDDCELKVNIQTVLPLVLIVNELLTNTFKHAYNPNTFLVIHIFISKIQDNKYQLIYKDNGPGLPQNFSNSTRFGLKLLKLFSEQLRGNIQFKNENGAVFILAFEYE